MAEDNVASLFQSQEEFDNLLQILKQSIDNPDSSPENVDQLSVSPSSSESSTCNTDEEYEENFTNDQISEIQSCLEHNLKEPPVELRQYSLLATFGPRRKPEMTFMLSISNALSSLPFNEKCSVELNGDEISTNYDPFNKKSRVPSNKIWKTGYCVHARLYLRDEKSVVQIRSKNPSPLSYVYCKDRFSAFKDGQLKLRIRENLTMKHLPVTDDKNPPQLLIQFSLTFQGEKLLETAQLPISFTFSKKKKFAETTDIIFSPSKIPSTVAPLLEPSTKRIKSEPMPQSSLPQNQFPTASAIWSSTSPVDIINYLEAQMMSSQQYNYIPTVYMLVPAKPAQNHVMMTSFPTNPPIVPMYAPAPVSPQKSPRKFQAPKVEDLYSNIQINGAMSVTQPLGEILPTMTPKRMEGHVPLDPVQMECWLDSLSS